MELTDEIRNYTVTKALPFELMKTSEEYYVLGVLKYCNPIQFGNLHKSEAPDLQDREGFLGIEITNALSQQDRQISGESLKYLHAKKETERERALKRIWMNGGDYNGFCTSYPVGTAEKDKKNVQKAYSSKIEKLKRYREKCSIVGLVIIIDIPLFCWEESKWANLLPKKNEDNYDFVILSYWSGIDVYDMKTDKYNRYEIGRKDMDALKHLGRMTAEGIIKEDDPIWQVNNN